MSSPLTYGQAPGSGSSTGTGTDTATGTDTGTDTGTGTPGGAPSGAGGGTGAAQVIAGSAGALAVAAELAREFRAGAARRDAERLLPRAELDRLSASGLLAVTVPREYGGADVPASTLAEVFRLLATGDASLAQIPQSHFAYVNVLRRQGSPEQRRFFFGEILAGRRFGNAQSEKGTKHVQDFRTRLEPAATAGGTAPTDGTENAGEPENAEASRAPRGEPGAYEGDFVLTGLKHYSTGALFADWIPVLARASHADGALHVAYVPHDAPGVTVEDDWDGMGQRTTASGTVRLDRVHVPRERVVAHHLTFEGPQLHGAVAQLLHAAIDAGIAAGALADAADFVRTKSRPWFESGVERASDDPLLIQRFGELSLSVRAAEALLAAAARAVDTASADLTDDSAAEASIAVAAAKVQAANTAVETGSALFELAGTRSALDSLNLHRHWRDARTHTLHDPPRWKLQHIGRYALDGTRPPRHGLL